jgi:hypothetical protein
MIRIAGCILCSPLETEMGASLTGRIEHSCEDMMHVAIHVTVQLKDLTFDYTGRRILCLTYEMY